MDEPHPDIPERFAERAALDRSQQAARFLDLTRQPSLLDDDDDDVLPPLAAAHLRALMVAGVDGMAIVADDDSSDGPADDDDDADDISIDSAAFGMMRPGSVPPGAGLGGFTLDDDGDVFGDGNGFGGGTGFGNKAD